MKAFWVYSISAAIMNLCSYWSSVIWNDWKYIDDGHKINNVLRDCRVNKYFDSSSEQFTNWFVWITYSLPDLNVYFIICCRQVCSWSITRYNIMAFASSNFPVHSTFSGLDFKWGLSWTIMHCCCQNESKLSENGNLHSHMGWWACWKGKLLAVICLDITKLWQKLW